MLHTLGKQITTKNQKSLTHRAVDFSTLGKQFGEWGIRTKLLSGLKTFKKKSQK